MSNVVDLNEYRKRPKKERKKEKKTDKPVPKPANQNFQYTGKLGEAMRKYGSSTGNVLKEQFKKKEKLETED